MEAIISPVESPKSTASTSQVEYMKSLRTGLRVLVEFERAPRDLGVTDLANRCGLSKSQVFKILSALVDSGLVVQDHATRTYHIGQRCFLLGSRFTTYDALCQAATPVMRELLNRTGHSIRLSIPHDSESLYLFGLEGPHFMDTGWRSGNCVPMCASSAGRVMMAFMEPNECERMLDMPIPALTPQTIRDRATLKAIVEQARTRGYVIQRNETSLGLGVISVPLFNSEQAVIGSIGAAFPTHVLPPEEEPQLASALHDAARAISQRLGCQAYPVHAIPT